VSSSVSTIIYGTRTVFGVLDPTKQENFYNYLHYNYHHHHYHPQINTQGYSK